MVDIFHGMFKNLKHDVCEKILDIIEKSNDDMCMLFTARLGDILHSIDKSSTV